MQDVAFDGASGGGGVPSREFLRDVAVLVKGLAHALRTLPKHVARKLIPHLFDQIEEHRVAGRFVQGPMKPAIRRAQPFQVVACEGGLHRPRMPADPFDRLLGRSGGRQPRCFGFEQGANAVDVRDAVGIEVGNAHPPMRLVHQQALGHQFQRRLARRRTHGDWEAWLEFFLDAVQLCAAQAVATARQINQLVGADRLRVAALGRTATPGLVFEALAKRPVRSVASICAVTGQSPVTVNTTLLRLQAIGLVREMTGKRRGRVFGYQAYIDALNRDALFDVPLATGLPVNPNY